jgi:uncharacterized membrane-anchored protein YjiN (DUF445 family)
MVGALADLIAVVVLFRHPFDIQISHTAIIPKSKDRIGSILGNDRNVMKKNLNR